MLEFENVLYAIFICHFCSDKQVQLKIRSYLIKEYKILNMQKSASVRAPSNV